jgi:replicative DNA helicase
MKNILTGYPTLDEKIGGGLVRGGINLITASAGKGKSTLICDIVNKLTERNLNCLFITMGDMNTECVRKKLNHPVNHVSLDANMGISHHTLLTFIESLTIEKKYDAIFLEDVFMLKTNDYKTQKLFLEKLHKLANEENIAITISLQAYRSVETDHPAEQGGSMASVHVAQLALSITEAIPSEFYDDMLIMTINVVKNKQGKSNVQTEIAVKYDKEL